jgi:hypothetical protein
VYEIGAKHPFRLSFRAFVPLFVAFDVVGIVPLSLVLMHRLTVAEQQAALRSSLLIAAAVSSAFALLGTAIFPFLGITVTDFQIAGGLVLLGLAGLDFLTSEPRGLAEGTDVGVVPLGVPLIAGPAVLTTTIVLVDLYGTFVTLLALVREPHGVRARAGARRARRAPVRTDRFARHIEDREPPAGRDRRALDPPGFQPVSVSLIRLRREMHAPATSSNPRVHRRRRGGKGRYDFECPPGEFVDPVSAVEIGDVGRGGEACADAEAVRCGLCPTAAAFPGCEERPVVEPVADGTATEEPLEFLDNTPSGGSRARIPFAEV